MPTKTKAQMQHELEQLVQELRRSEAMRAVEITQREEVN
jgi:hypothetical protein